MFSINHFKVRSTALKRLGYRNYVAYLRSEWWQQRRAAYAASVPPFCHFCGEPAEDLHHRSYKRLGREDDADLLWLCRRHHAEAHERGIIGRPTDVMKTILCGHGYEEDVIDKMTFGDAYDLIAGIGRGTVETPQMVTRPKSLSSDPAVVAILLDGRPA